MSQLPAPSIIRMIKSKPQTISVDLDINQSAIAPSSLSNRYMRESHNQISVSNSKSGTQHLPSVFQGQTKRQKNNSPITIPYSQIQKLQELNKRALIAINDKLVDDYQIQMVTKRETLEMAQEYYEPTVEEEGIKDNISRDGKIGKSQLKPKQEHDQLDKTLIKSRQMRTKHPSLPRLSQALNGQPNKYYDKWYIPYNQRYIKKQRVTTMELKNNPYAKDDKHFYNNLHNVQEWLIYDPFQTNLPSDALDLVQQSKRLDSLKEMLKGSKVIHDYKKMLDNAGARVPFFIKQVIEEN